MEVAEVSFCRWALVLSGAGTDNRTKRHHVRVVSAPFCVMQYIDDPWYLPGSGKSMTTRRLRPNETSVELRATVAKSRAE